MDWGPAGSSVHRILWARTLEWVARPSNPGMEPPSPESAGGFFTSSLLAQLVKNLPAMPDTWVWSLFGKIALEKGMATHASILDWRIPWTVESTGSLRVRHDWATFTFAFFATSSTWEVPCGTVVLVTPTLKVPVILGGTMSCVQICTCLWESS